MHKFRFEKSSRRFFLRSASLAATASLIGKTPGLHATPVADPRDAQRIRDLAAWTSLTFKTDNPVPFGAEIFHTRSGESLMRVANAVSPEHDPSAHAELRAVRLACKKLNAYRLTGYTLYTTCEPCPMCMGCILWAGVDRMVYGATIADAARFGHQIMIPAAEVARRTDIKCIVDGPVERAACVALFTNPAMQKAYEKWKKEGEL